MAIRIENTFVVPASVEQAWALLTDVPRIAPCLPGAELTEIVDATTYKGRARVKIGPMQLAFSGEARLSEADESRRISRMSIRGSDTKGRGNVQSEMTFALVSDDAGTRVNVVTELSLSGSVAQYGRGVGLIKEICNQYAAQFAKNLAAQIQGGEADSKPPSAVALVSGGVRAMVAGKGETEKGDDGNPSEGR